MMRDVATTTGLTTLFALALLLVAPGPTNALLMAAGALHGRGKALRLLGAVIGAYLLGVGALGLLLAPVLAAEPQLAAIVKVLAAAYLTCLAVRLWRAPLADAAAEVSPRALFIATLLNPKGLIIATVVLPAGWAASPGAALPWLTLLLALIPFTGGV
jgi:threonine/homoserine/homoserine lactone efflux protein